ncbi:MAG: hypothetical protein J5993_03995 [Clostridia bacterium]|nr:hypothetical protein [Clostridia bacterium]
MNRIQQYLYFGNAEITVNDVILVTYRPIAKHLIMIPIERCNIGIQRLPSTRYTAFCKFP